MNPDIIEGEVVSTALAVAQRPSEPVALFGSDDPVEILARAVKVSDALVSVIEQKRLVKDISGKRYPLFEAWQTLGALLRVTPFTEWTRPIEGGWEARVVIRDSTGRELAAAENQCTRKEKMWANRDDYAIRSMAQTRSAGKAYRSVLGFVMVLAGYEATPAEEMPTEPRPVAPAKPPKDRSEDAARLSAACEAAVALGLIERPEPALLRAWAEPRGLLVDGKLTPRALVNIEDAIEILETEMAADAVEWEVEPEEVVRPSTEAPVAEAPAGTDGLPTGAEPPPENVVAFQPDPELKRLRREQGMLATTLAMTDNRRHALMVRMFQRLKDVPFDTVSATMLTLPELQAFVRRLADLVREMPK